MKIKYKLLLFLIFFSLILVSILFINFYINNSSTQLYIQNQTQKLNIASKNALELNNELLASTVNDYTYWDQLLEFIEKPDTSWAEMNLYTLVAYKYIDYLWMYNLDVNLFFKAEKEEFPEIEKPLEATKIYDLMDTTENSSKRFAHFYLKTDSGLHVIYSSTVHSESDAVRLKKPGGFMFLGKKIDENFIAKLGQITNSKVTLLSDTISFQKPNELAIYTLLHVTDVNNKYIATLLFVKEDDYISQNKANQSKTLLIILIIIIASVLFVAFMFNNIFTKPFQAIISSLNSNNTAPLSRIKNKENEFGQIAKLIESFFKQKVLLENEIEERKLIMRELAEKNEELQTAEEELRQGNEELRALNENLEQVKNIIEEKEQRLKTIIDNQGEGFGIIDFEQNCTFSNVVACEIFEVPNGTLVGRNLREFVEETDWEIISEHAIIRREGIRSTYEIQIKTAKNNRKNILVTGAPDYDTNGEIIGTIASFIDITLKKTYETEMLLQKQAIELAHKEILSSINYAKTIQQSLLTSETLISKYIPKHFILYLPKDNVSGDFYYINRMDNIIILAAADCTGHGVAGAFLTVLGITYLHEAVRNEKTRQPSEALHLLRERFKNTLRTFGAQTNNGIDIALCEYNTETKILQYAGANNPIWIARNGEILEFEPTRNPIGFYPKERPFENHQIQIQNNDLIYMFSDGYHDQFGGENNTKLKATHFKNLLLSISHLPMNEQKDALNNFHNNWKGDEKQTDDLLVMGFKIDDDI